MRPFRLAVLLALTAAFLGTAVWAASNLDTLEPERVAESLRGFGEHAPAAFAVARIVGAIVLLPGAVIAIAAGMLFGPVWGTIYNVLAATVGAVIAFAIARFVAPNFAAHVVERRVGLKPLMQSIDAEGWRFVLFVRLVPILPYNLLNYALGLTSIRLRPFTLATLVGIIPIDIAYSYLGYAGYQALAGESRDALTSVMIGVGLFAALLFVPPFVRRHRRRREA